MNSRINKLSIVGGTVAAVLAAFTLNTMAATADEATSVPSSGGLKHAIGVKDFEKQTGYKGWWELNQNLSILMESALYDTGRFVIVEREKLHHVIAEQDLAASGRTAKASRVARTGKLRPARFLATGAVTEIEVNQSGGGGGVSIKGITVGARRNKATITIIAKLVDTTTGEIVAKKRIVGKAKRTNVNLGFSGKSISTGIDGFRKTPIGDATQDAVNAAAKFFAATIREMPVTGTIVAVKGNAVIINRGTMHNFQKGLTLSITTPGEELIDPETGEILDRLEGEVTGRLQVVKVRDKISFCRVVNATSPAERGMEVVVAD